VSPAPTPAAPVTVAPPTTTSGAPTAPLSPARAEAQPAPVADWTKIEIPGDHDDEIVPWDSKPLIIAIVAGVILILLGIASGLATSKIFYPGQTVTTWHPTHQAPSPPK
jgi:hypothetical protein